MRHSNVFQRVENHWQCHSRDTKDNQINILISLHHTYVTEIPNRTTLSFGGLSWVEQNAANVSLFKNWAKTSPDDTQMSLPVMRTPTSFLLVAALLPLDRYHSMVRWNAAFRQACDSLLSGGYLLCKTYSWQNVPISPLPLWFDSQQEVIHHTTPSCKPARNERMNIQRKCSDPSGKGSATSENF